MKNILIENIDLVIKLIENELNFNKKTFKGFYDRKDEEYNMLLRREKLLNKIIKKVK